MLRCAVWKITSARLMCLKCLYKCWENYSSLGVQPKGSASLHSCANKILPCFSTHLLKKECPPPPFHIALYCEQWLKTDLWDSFIVLPGNAKGWIWNRLPAKFVQPLLITTAGLARHPSINQAWPYLPPEIRQSWYVHNGMVAPLVSSFGWRQAGTTTLHMDDPILAPTMPIWVLRVDDTILLIKVKTHIVKNLCPYNGMMLHS